MVTEKLNKLQDLMRVRYSHHIFVRFQTQSRCIIGPLQRLFVELKERKVTCFFGENGITNKVEIPVRDLVDVAVFCTAEHKPVFLKDFATVRGEISAFRGMYSQETAQQELLDQATENAEIFENTEE